MSLWSARQHEWLEAMGLDVFQTASAAPGEHAAPEATRPADASGQVASPDRARLPRALLQVLRARPEPAADLDALDVDLDALRRDPAAKRALWTRLRALRARPR